MEAETTRATAAPVTLASPRGEDAGIARVGADSVITTVLIVDTRVADQAGRATHQPFTFYLAVCVLYLALTALSGHVLGRLTQRCSAGVGRRR